MCLSYIFYQYLDFLEAKQTSLNFVCSSNTKNNALNIEVTQKHPLICEWLPCARHWFCLVSKTVPAFKIFMGDRHVSKEFKYDRASNKIESQIGKYGSPDLELNQRKDVVWKRSGLSQEVYKFMVLRCRLSRRWQYSGCDHIS